VLCLKTEVLQSIGGQENAIFEVYVLGIEDITLLEIFELFITMRLGLHFLCVWMPLLKKLYLL